MDNESPDIGSSLLTLEPTRRKLPHPPRRFETIPLNALQSSSQRQHKAPSPGQQPPRQPRGTLQRRDASACDQKYILRSSLSVCGAVAFTTLYVVIVYVYIEAPVEQGIARGHLVDARLIFYLWFIACVFALDWSRAGLAIVEVAGISSQNLAPRSAMQSMWHSDTSWSGPVGWIGALRAAMKESARRSRRVKQKPGRLWLVLASVNLPLWVAVPLSGFSFEVQSASVISSKAARILGVNETTFDSRKSHLLWESAYARWSSGDVVTPPGASLIYAPTHAGPASDTYLDDAIHQLNSNQDLSFFIGPEVDSRVNGRTWGLAVRVVSEAVSPLNQTLIPFRAYWENPLDAGVSGPYWYRGITIKRVRMEPIYGIGSVMILATDSDTTSGIYSNVLTRRRANVTRNGQTFFQNKFQVGVQQWYDGWMSNIADTSMEEMEHHPAVHVNASAYDSSAPFLSSQIVLTYGLSFEIESAVGYAELSARDRTFSQFRTQPARLLETLFNASKAIETVEAGCWSLSDFNETKRCLQGLSRLQQTMSNNYNGFREGDGGIPLLEQLLLNALIGTRTVNDTGLAAISPWYHANVATGGKATLARYIAGRNDSAVHNNSLSLPYFQMTAIDPARMRVAILKMIGEVAIAMMGTGPEPFTAGLSTVSQAAILRPGIISWKLILPLLVLWTVLFVGLISVYGFRSRFAATLNGYQLFRFGALWGQELRGTPLTNFTDLDLLSQIPTQAELRLAGAERLYGFAGVTIHRQRKASS
ncbi:hypothetical protein H2200_008798 [Cladophialophora chaetospira]|uniref:Uncharacterized protein n=1 Tax=Cladophialophora chaetospira TaxID=386627 RepID=A0AA39CFX5_9EURO|nr:hypothetical protein H2200_008798 [Cladophialophora chaetospira]